MYFDMGMFGYNYIRTHIKVSNACSHVECSSDKCRLIHVNFIDDPNTTHGLVTGDGNFPI